VAIYTLQDLKFAYPKQTKNTLKGLNFSIGEGEFVTIAGPSGCGKSTLLRHLKTTLSPSGKCSGSILFKGRPLERVEMREQSAQIGFVMQSPDNQIVTDKVWHELAFGLESLGEDTQTIRCRVAEMAHFFGIEKWFYKDVNTLSGGQKQILNLASVMVMQPSVLILDEPTSQLDPIAASEFIATLGKINHELGTTVVITEHRLEEVLPLSDRVIMMDDGRIICDDVPQHVGNQLIGSGHQMWHALPAPMRVYAALADEQLCPITVRDGRLWLDAYAKKNPVDTRIAEDRPILKSEGDPIIALKDVWFKYDRALPDVIKGLSLEVHKGEFLALLGGNGTGKTTMLSLISKINKPYRGKVILDKNMAPDNTSQVHIGVLPQNPQALFIRNTVQEDLIDVLKQNGTHREAIKQKMAWVSRLCQIEHLHDQHPYDLSGGEQQRVALAKVLLMAPKVLLLDEPTKGFDATFKRTFAVIINEFLTEGMTVIMVSHDIEFCAEYAHRCALFFDGNIVAMGEPRTFFSGNSFYTTAANRMSRHMIDKAITVEDIVIACGGKPPEMPVIPKKGDSFLEDSSENKENFASVIDAKSGDENKWGTVVASISFLLSLILLPWLIFNHSKIYIGVLLLMALSLVFIFGVYKPINRASHYRHLVAILVICVAVPMTLYFGTHFLGSRKYAIISILVIAEIILPFILMFEGRKPQAREVVLIAVLCAIAVTGRVVFFMLPQFKPVIALVIISGVAFGSETGFLVGAVSMLASNILVGQGPWTPWQMFAMGIIGFLAGAFFSEGVFKHNRLLLCLYGAISAVIIYGGLMNPSYVIMYNDNVTMQMILATYTTGLPYDLVQAISTIFFLWFISKPMLEKLNRIKIKYGLLNS